MISFFRNIKNNIRISDTMLIVIILLAGAILRFWRLNEIPFTYDEFSALFRTQFDTFHELIEKGVKIDTHPAGVQVFLFYLVKIFGVSEAVVKTPFIIFGLLSVWLVYRVGKYWFSPATGLVAASFLSFLQYPVIYSQIARPYSSGLFFCLLMVFFWTKVLFYPERKYYPNLAGYIVAGALCVYNHHFSLLFAAMVGITGLFFCPRSNIRSYTLAGAAIIILYLPHLSIFFTQLGMGGVEDWLGKPRYDFIYDFIQYVFQFSVFVYVLVAVLVILQFFWHQKTPPLKHKFIMISALWFLIPYLAGFFYSKYVNAVLQYSVLIYSFPYLLFLLFGNFNTEKAHHLVILVALVGLVVIPSLMVERQHYRLFYKSPYREILVESKHLSDSLGAGNCSILLDTKKEINTWYLARYHLTGLRFKYLSLLQGKRGLQEYLNRCSTNYLAFGCISSSPNENYPMILEKYPFLVRHQAYVGGDFYLFSKARPIEERSEYFYKVVNTFEPSASEWGWVNPKQCIDSLAINGSKSFAVRDGAEYGPTFNVPLRPLLHGENDVVDISADLRLPSVFSNAWLVVSVTSDKRNIYWNSIPVRDYLSPGQTGRVFISMRLSDIEMRHHRMMFMTFLWNPGKLNYIMDNVTVRVRSGNPVIYGLFKKVER